MDDGNGHGDVGSDVQIICEFTLLALTLMLMLLLKGIAVWDPEHYDVTVCFHSVGSGTL